MDQRSFLVYYGHVPIAGKQTKKPSEIDDNIKPEGSEAYYANDYHKHP